MLPAMSLFTVNIVARSPQDESRVTPRRSRTFVTATKQIVSREVGYAVLAAESFETTDEVVFAQPGDMILLGVRTTDGFGVSVDNVGRRFVAQNTIVASAGFIRQAPAAASGTA
jgi:hypothetical protein